MRDLRNRSDFPFDSLIIRLRIAFAERRVIKSSAGFKLVTYRAAARQRGKFRRNFPAMRLAYAREKKRVFPKARTNFQ